MENTHMINSIICFWTSYRGFCFCMPSGQIFHLSDMYQSRESERRKKSLFGILLPWFTQAQPHGRRISRSKTITTCAIHGSMGNKVQGGWDQQKRGLPKHVGVKGKPPQPLTKRQSRLNPKIQT